MIKYTRKQLHIKEYKKMNEEKRTSEYEIDSGDFIDVEYFRQNQRFFFYRLIDLYGSTARQVELLAHTFDLCAIRR